MPSAQSERKSVAPMDAEQLLRTLPRGITGILKKPDASFAIFEHGGAYSLFYRLDDGTAKCVDFIPSERIYKSKKITEQAFIQALKARDLGEPVMLRLTPTIESALELAKITPKKTMQDNGENPTPSATESLSVSWNLPSSEQGSNQNCMFHSASAALGKTINVSIPASYLVAVLTQDPGRVADVGKSALKDLGSLSRGEFPLATKGFQFLWGGMPLKDLKAGLKKEFNINTELELINAGNAEQFSYQLSGLLAKGPLVFSYSAQGGADFEQIRQLALQGSLPTQQGPAGKRNEVTPGLKTLENMRDLANEITLLETGEKSMRVIVQRELELITTADPRANKQNYQSAVEQLEYLRESKLEDLRALRQLQSSEPRASGVADWLTSDHMALITGIDLLKTSDGKVDPYRSTITYQDSKPAYGSTDASLSGVNRRMSVAELMLRCGVEPKSAYNAQSSATLRDVFSSIGGGLEVLRIVDSPDAKIPSGFKLRPVIEINPLKSGIGGGLNASYLLDDFGFSLSAYALSVGGYDTIAEGRFRDLLWVRAEKYAPSGQIPVEQFSARLNLGELALTYSESGQGGWKDWAEGWDGRFNLSHQIGDYSAGVYYQAKNGPNEFGMRFVGQGLDINVERFGSVDKEIKFGVQYSMSF